MSCEIEWRSLRARARRQESGDGFSGVKEPSSGFCPASSCPGRSSVGASRTRRRRDRRSRRPRQGQGLAGGVRRGHAKNPRLACCSGGGAAAGFLLLSQRDLGKVREHTVGVLARVGRVTPRDLRLGGRVQATDPGFWSTSRRMLTRTSRRSLSRRHVRWSSRPDPQVPADPRKPAEPRQGRLDAAVRQAMLALLLRSYRIQPGRSRWRVRGSLLGQTGAITRERDLAVQ